jgi:hypothetical protein
VYVVTRTQDRSRAEKSDAGDDLGRDARRVDILAETWQPSKRGEHARADCDQPHRLDAGRMTAKLSFSPQCETKKQRHDQADT